MDIDNNDKFTINTYLIKMLLIALLLASIGQVMSDLYLSSLPAIKSAMNTSTHRVQFTVSSFVFGFAFSQLIYGPISDAYGRRKPLIIGLLITVAGSGICYLSQSIEVMIFGRFLQGLGSGVGLALSRSILRDTFTGKQLAKMGSFFAVGNIAIMTSSPFVGAIILSFIGWRANFAFLLIYSLAALFITIFLLPETNIHMNKSYIKLDYIKGSLLELFRNKNFLGFTSCITLTYSAILAWIVISPILLIHRLNMHPIAFGLANIGIGVIYALTSISNAVLLNKYTPSSLINFGLLLMLVGGILLFPTVIFHHWLAVILPIYIFIAGTSYIFANGIAGALTPFPKIAGFAGAMLGFWEILGGALSSTTIASFGLDTQIWMAIFITSLTVITIILKLFLFEI